MTFFQCKNCLIYYLLTNYLPVQGLAYGWVVLKYFDKKLCQKPFGCLKKWEMKETADNHMAADILERLQ